MLVSCKIQLSVDQNKQVHCDDVNHPPSVCVPDVVLYVLPQPTHCNDQLPEIFNISAVLSAVHYVWYSERDSISTSTCWSKISQQVMTVFLLNLW